VRTKEVTYRACKAILQYNGTHIIQVSVANSTTAICTSGEGATCCSDEYRPNPYLRAISEGPKRPSERVQTGKSTKTIVPRSSHETKSLLKDRLIVSKLNTTRGSKDEYFPFNRQLVHGNYLTV
jgi:hypothetical protein